MALDMELLLDAVRRVESGGNPNAVSPKGAKGPYQFMDATAAEYGVTDPFDEKQSREGARRYLTDLMNQFGSPELALAAYNGGPGRLKRVGSLQAMPKESRDYVAKVMDHYAAGVTVADSNRRRLGLEGATPPLEELFPGAQGIANRARSALFPANRENDALRASVLNPRPLSEAQRIYEMQLRTGLPVGLIERNLDSIEQRAKREDFDPDAFRRESPLLAEWLAKNPTRAALAQGDYENLSMLEKAWATMKAIPTGLEIGWKQERLLTLDYKAAVGELTPQEEIESEKLEIELNLLSQEADEGLPVWFREAGSIVGLQIPMAVEATRKGIKYGVPMGAVAGAGLGAIGGPGAPVTVPAGAAMGGAVGFKAASAASYAEHTYRLSVGEAFRDLKNAEDAAGNKIDPVAARYASLLVAVPNSLLEFASLRAAIRVIPGADKVIGKLTNSAMKEVLTRPSVMAALAGFSKKYAAAVGTETFTEGMQKMMVILAREIATGDMGAGLTEADAQAVAEESLAAFKGSVVLGALASGPKVIELYADIEKAKLNQEFMLNLGGIAQGSKTAANSPKAFGEYVNHLKENGSVKNVFIPIESWNALFQDKAPDAAKEVFGNLEQYAQAETTGGDLVIPIETYAEKLAGTQFHEQLSQNMRLAAGEMTPVEAAEALQREPEITAALQEEMATTMAKEAPLLQVYNDVYEKLRSVGMSTQEANRDAVLWRERLRARAERLGVDPLQLYQEAPLTIQRELPNMPDMLVSYNQQLAEPAVPFAQKLPLEGGEINLPPATDQEITAAVATVEAATASEREFGVFGATIHPTRGNLAGTEGVAVAGYPQRGVVVEGAPTPADLEVFQRRNRDIFEADPNAAIGVWVDSETGLGYIDIANVLSRDMAIAQGEYLGEKAVWDLQAFEEIRLPIKRETGQGVLFQPAFHGTRYHFDKFSLEHLGEGEGAQVFGWGLYFASEKAVAESYRKQLTDQLASPFIVIQVNGVPLRDFLAPLKNEIKPVLLVKAGSYMQPIANGGTWDNVFANLYADRDKQLRYADEDSIDDIYANFDGIEKALHILQKQEISVKEPNKGQVYRVELPDEKHMLRWDEPLSQQPKIVQEAVEAIAGSIPGDPDGRTIYQVISDKLKSDKEASIALNAFGVPGLKYLDGSSRSRGEGSYNFVIFDDNAIEIVETYYQGERGASVPSKHLIALFKGADPSTFIHESGHLWLEELRQDALRPDAPDQLKADWEMVKAWTGATDDAISTEAHETFARGIEAYIMEGDAPSFQLREVFSQFMNWLTRIYKSLTMLDVELTDEVRDVMDRLIATDEAIKQSRDRNEYDIPLLDSSVMTPEEFAAYTQLNEEAKRTAEDNFRAKVLKELRREKTETYRKELKAMKSKVREELLDTPIYRAAYWLWSGSLPDGTKIEGMAATKLDKQALLDMGVTPADLPFRYQENGLHPDVVAEMFGFPSGESLVRELIGLPTLKEAIDTEATRRLREEKGGVMVEGVTMDDAAMEVQNTQQIDVFNMELRILKRLGARREKTHPAVIKDIARQMIARTKLGELQPRLFEEAAMKAGQEAQAAMLGHEFRMGTGRNLDIAFDAKQRQMLNIFLFREATEQRRQAERSVRKWKKFLSRSNERLAKTYNMDMVNAARAIASVHGIGTADQPAGGYMRNLQAYDPDTYNSLKDLVEMASSDGRKVDDLTVDEFAIVRDAIEGLWTLARRSRQIEIDGVRMERDQVIGELNARVNELVVPDRPRAGYHRAVSQMDKAKMGFMGLRAMLRRVEHWVDAVDDGNPNGVFRRYVWNPISEASDLYRDQRRVTLEKYLEIAKKFPKESSAPGKIDAYEIQYEFANKTELLGAILHTGNESNLQKLLRGREWGHFNEMGDLDASRWNAFIKRMQDTGVLTKADYAFVQDVWDLFESLKPAAQKAHKEMYGYFFEEITARPVVTPFGTFRGGYYPATVDPFIVEDAAIRAELEALESKPSSFMFPTTGRGFTKHRSEQYAKPLSLDIGMIPQQIEKVLRFTHIEPHVKDVGRVVVNPEFRNHLAELDSEVGSVMLMPWLQRAALQQVEQPSGPRLRQMDAFFHAVRTRTGLQFMAANVSVALQQLTGISLAAVKVKPRYLAGALWRYASNPRRYAEEMHASSSFMRNRVSTQIMDVHRAIDNILLNPSKFQKARNFFNEHGYFLQVAMQNVVDAATWGGAYEQAMANGATEKEAVRQADSAVRETQGTFAPEDISRIEAGSPLLRAFTMFYSFFNMSANLSATEFSKAMRKQGFAAGGRALYVYTFGFMVPAVVAEAIVQAMSGELFDDDDDDGYLDNLLSVFFGGQARMATAMVPAIGPAIQVGINAFNDKWYDDRINLSPAVSALEASARVPYDAYRLAVEDEARLNRPIKDVFTLIGLATGLPVAPLAKPIGYLTDVEQGFIEEPDNPVEFTRGLVSGRAPQ